MKRINMSIDVEENELLANSVKQAMLGQARQIAREALEKELFLEIDRITTARINEVKQSTYWNSVASRITDIIVQRFGNEISINTKEVNELIEAKVTEYLDKKLSSRGGLDYFIQSYMDKSIATILMKNINR